MPDTDLILNPNFIYFIIGIIVLCNAVVSTFIGKAYSGRGGWAYRSKEPTKFWLGVAVMYIGSILFIGKYLGSVLSAPILHPDQWMRLK